MWNEKLKMDLEIPEGWFEVVEGNSRWGDRVWMREVGVAGQWNAVTCYTVGQAVDGFWCVIRRWVDDGSGI